MNDKLHKISKLLYEFQSLREEHILKICDCEKEDIDLLIAKKVLLRNKNGIIKHIQKEINNRNIVAFDVVMEYLDRDPKIIKGKHPVNVTLKTKFVTYDIIAIKEDEINKLYEELDIVSKSDKVIIIIETKNYIPRRINTERECYICTFPPLEIVDDYNRD